MSRLRLPRRFPLGISALAAALLFALPAAAQDPNADPRSLTVIGADAHARRCASNTVAGNVTDEAVSECTRALHYARLTHEAEIELLIDRGVTYLRRHDSELALNDFDAVVALDARNAEAHMNRGAALVQLNRAGEAIAALTTALGLGVREPYKAYYNRGAAREALGDLQGAYEDYSTALQIQPDWGPANAEVARFVRGRREHLATVLNQPPSTP